jgi:hypothetical protein
MSKSVMLQQEEVAVDGSEIVRAIRPKILTAEDREVTVGEEMEKTESKNLAWQLRDGKYYPSHQVIPTLPAGEYFADYNYQQDMPFFLSKVVVSDDLVNLPDESIQQVLRSISKFWTLEGKFKEHGFIWKRGILLWGPPGGGKTTTIHLLAEQIVRENGITLYGDVNEPHKLSQCIRSLRQIEPSRPLVVVLEDIDAIRSENESDILSILDGEEHTSNIVYLASTNYPEKLDPRIINRPSRFDEIVYIGLPDKTSREIFIRQKGKSLTGEQIAKWTESTEGFSISHLKELLVSVECLGNEFTATIKRLRDMYNIPTSSRPPGAPKFGFNKE